MPTAPDPIHGELGVLRDDGERVQCHACGEWYSHLRVHTTLLTASTLTANGNGSVSSNGGTARAEHGVHAATVADQIAALT